MYRAATLTSAAVSVLSRAGPSDRGVYPACIAVWISFGEKSPSGPIIIVTSAGRGVFSGIMELIWLLMWSGSQKAIYFNSWQFGLPAVWAMTSANPVSSSTCGRTLLSDCLAAERTIFLALSVFRTFLSEWSHRSGVILSTPISVAFSRNHSNLSIFFVGATHIRSL